MENFHKELEKTILLIPALSVGSIGTLTLDILINNNSFKRIGYFKTNSLQPSIGRLPDILKSEEKALALPAEIYFNGVITILQVRSHVKEGAVKEILKDINEFIEKHSFESVLVISSTSFNAKSDFEISSSTKNIYFYSNEQFKSNSLDLSKLLSLEKFINKTYDEKIADLIAGGGLMLKMIKKKEFKKLPILFLVVYSVPGEDTQGAIAMCKAVGEVFQKQEIKPFSQSTYILPKYFLI